MKPSTTRLPVYHAVNRTRSFGPHGASPKHELACSRLSAPRPPHAEAIRVGPVVPGDHAVAPGADSKGHGVLFAHCRAVRHTDDSRWMGDAGAPVQQSEYLDSGSAV